MKRLRLLGLVAAVASVILTTAVAADSPKVSPAAAEVVRLAESGVGDEVVLGYVKASKSAFNLSADEILYLKEKGLSGPVITAMLNHDAALKGESAPPAPAPATATEEATTSERQVMKDPPPEVAQFYEVLAPYGEWVQIDNFGWCWQPPEATNKTWRPYCDGGHWMSTDSGWFWESDYPWGATAFHYGRWALNSRAGWVWAPDKTWGPAWVIWRTVEDLVGWAPLPPKSVYDSRAGWKFNGLPVNSIFDFGLKQEAYTFVPLREFTQKDLASRRLGVAEVARLFGRTTIMNGYTFENQTLVNQGISTKQISAATHAPVPQAVIYDLAAGAGPPPPLPDGRFRVFRPEFRPPLRPPLVEFQRVDERHPFIHHRPPGERLAGPGRPGGPGGPGGPAPGGGPRPGGAGPGGPTPGGGKAAPAGGGAPGKRP